MDFIRNYHFQKSAAEEGKWNAVVLSSGFNFQPAFQEKQCLSDHTMCGYTCVPLQSFENPCHFVQQNKRGLRDVKSVQILQKTGRREFL